MCHSPITSPQEAVVRAIVVDDKSYVCDILAELLPRLNQHLTVVATFTRPPTLSELARAQPRIAILDVIGCQGLDVARQIRTLFPCCGVIFLTAYPVPSLEEGAAGVPGALTLYKPAFIQQLAHAINGLIDQAKMPPHQSAEVWRNRPPRRHTLSNLTSQPPPGVVSKLWPLVSKLTPREIEYAYLRAHGLSNREIADRLHIGVQRAYNLGSRLLQKFGCRSMCQCVAFLHRAGILGRDEMPPVKQ